MAGYDEKIARSNVPIPETIANEIIQTAAEHSVALRKMKPGRMSTKTLKTPVLSALPQAYWLSGDTALKQTTHAEWDNVVMTAEEVAVLLPIPNAVVDDTNIPLWETCKPLLAEAIGMKVDLATLWGIEKPASFPTALIPGAVAAGNVETVAANADLTQAIANLAGRVDEDGFVVNGFMAKPGFHWKLVGLRASDGHPIYDPSARQLYGVGIDEARNGSWQTTAPETHLVAADWSKFIAAIRQDMTFDMFDQMVISDDAGKVIFNAAQQDSKVMRLVFRVGYQVANPITRVNTNNATRYPAGVLKATV